MQALVGKHLPIFRHYPADSSETALLHQHASEILSSSLEKPPWTIVSPRSARMVVRLASTIGFSGLQPKTNRN